MYEGVALGEETRPTLSVDGSDLSQRIPRSLDDVFFNVNLKYPVGREIEESDVRLMTVNELGCLLARKFATIPNHVTWFENWLKQPNRIFDGKSPKEVLEGTKYGTAILHERLVKMVL